MQIESPFGKVEVTFVRNNHCIVSTTALQPIEINGVKLNFYKNISIINGKWSMALCDNKGNFCINNSLELGFYDWKLCKRKRSRSVDSFISSIREKLHQWISDSFISDLMMGVYQNELNKAEIHYSMNKINILNCEIKTAKQIIKGYKGKIAVLSRIVNQ